MRHLAPSISRAAGAGAGADVRKVTDVVPAQFPANDTSSEDGILSFVDDLAVLISELYFGGRLSDPVETRSECRPHDQSNDSNDAGVKADDES
jgi:hypothetical protein